MIATKTKLKEAEQQVIYHHPKQATRIHFAKAGHPADYKTDRCEKKENKKATKRTNSIQAKKK